MSESRELVRLCDGGANNADERAAATLLSRIDDRQYEPPQGAEQRVYRRLEQAMGNSLLARALFRGRGSRRQLVVTGVVVAMVAPVVLVLVARSGDTQKEERAQSSDAPWIGGTVTVPAGRVNFADAADSSMTVESPARRLELDTRVIVEADSEALLRVPGGAVLRFGANSEFEQRASTGGPLIRMHRGSVLASVARRTAEHRLSIAAHGYVITVVGTQLRVIVDEQVRAEVQTGTVVVRGVGVEHTFSAGQCWSSRTDAITSCTQTRPLPRANPEPTPPPATQVAPRVESPPRLRNKVSSPKPTPDEPDKVVVEPEPDSEFGQELALYTLGQQKLRTAGDLAGAAAAFAEYRMRFPSGSLRQEVDLSIIEILVRQQRIARAELEMSQFVSQYPSSERRLEIIFLRGNARRELDRCPDALRDYRHVIAHAHETTLVDDATFYSAVCRADAGKQEAARRELHDYLERFPRGRHAVKARAWLNTKNEETADESHSQP